MSNELAFKRQTNRNRARAATALCHAVADCHPADACTIMAAALGDLPAGMPVAPLFSHVDQATFWAGWASVAELKTYCHACYERLPVREQAAQLACAGVTK